ncbi:hypothetical protein ABT391_26315 [Streptomyces jumonjinensis]
MGAAHGGGDVGEVGEVGEVAVRGEVVEPVDDVGGRPDTGLGVLD